MTFEDVKRIRENPTVEDVDNQEIHKLIDVALEKQIPKKPIKVDEYYSEATRKVEADYECASCGNPYIDDSFCSCCGQALDWSDTR